MNRILAFPGQPPDFLSPKETAMSASTTFAVRYIGEIVPRPPYLFDKTKPAELNH
jgi:hypothetical protein